MRFYLGTHEPSWLARTAEPLCVSRRRLARRVSLPRALGPWMLDSGGFTELSQHGGWATTAADYVAATRRYAEEIGQLTAAAVMDWMCEAEKVERTGLSIAEHQTRTVASYLELRMRAPELPWMPVLLGWDPGDYLRHIEQYARAGVDLAALPLVGVGSVCQRQHTQALREVFGAIAGQGLNLHAFGVKKLGLRHIAAQLTSADSMAWSYHARKRAPLPGCTHASCANCLRYATEWSRQLRASLPPQRALKL